MGAQKEKDAKSGNSYRKTNDQSGGSRNIITNNLANHKDYGRKDKQNNDYFKKKRSVLQADE